MYKKKGSDSIVIHLKRFLNHNYDSLRRLKALRNELEKVSVREAKQIMEKYSATVYYVTHTSFTTIETAITDRVTRNRTTHEQLRELKETVLPSFERLIILLPEKIQNKWQYNSLCLVIRKLLHPDNTLELRQYGIKLLVLWLQALQENSGDAAIELFASAIPYFPPKKTPLGLPDNQSSQPSGSGLTLCDRYGIYSRSKSNSSLPVTTSSSSTSFVNPIATGHNSYTCLSRDREWVESKEIGPIYSSSHFTQYTGTDPTIDLMDYLLNCLTVQIGRLKWTNNANHVKGFSFLFFQFKLFYLACLYRNFRSDAGLYCQPPIPVIEIPTLHSTDTDSHTHQSPIKTSVLSPSLPKHSKHTYSVSAVIKLDYDTSDPIYATIRELILKYLLKWIVPNFHSDHSIRPSPPTPSPALNAPSDQSFIPQADDMIRDMWFTSKDNINLLFEICHQGFKLQGSHFGYVNKLTQLYSSWVQGPDKPIFMNVPQLGMMSLPVGAESKGYKGASELSVLPWEVYSGYSNFDSSDVRAGPQQSIRMFIAHTRQLFLHEATPSLLNNQIDSCQKIIKLYQEIMLQSSLDRSGWIYLLKVLLHLCLELMQGSLSLGLGASLADLLLQTLLVGYVRASMCFDLPVELWDQLTSVLSFLSSWSQVVSQWSEIMKSLTHCLSRVVYHLDLDDLPLNRHGNQTFRIRTHTASSVENKFSKTSFIDIKPRLQHSHTTLGTTGRPDLNKAKTFDVDGNSNQTLTVTGGETARRHSTPARPMDGSKQSSHSASMPSKMVIKHEPVIEEEEPNEDNSKLLSEDYTLVISNENVSSSKEDEEVLSISQAPSSVPVLRRSLSESISIGNHLSKDKRQHSVRSLSPDLSRTHSRSPLTQAPVFASFIPQTTIDSVSTPPISVSPSSGSGTSSNNREVTLTLTTDEAELKEAQWNIVNVSKVWLRMIRSLDDVNNICDPRIHANVMNCLAEVWRMLIEIEKNSGVSLDNETTPILPPYLPPIMIILPWIVKACSLPPEYKEGRNTAYSMLCDITLRHVSCTVPPDNFLPHFYRLMYLGLQPSSDVLFTAIKGSSRLLSIGLKGVAVLFHDILDSCTTVLDTRNLEAPRMESLTLLGSLYYLTSHKRPKLTRFVTKAIFKAAVMEPLRQARCLALFQVGTICLSELGGDRLGKDESNTIRDGLDILVASLKYPDHSIVTSAVDMLTLLTERVDQLSPQLIVRVMQGITAAAATLINTSNTDKKIKMLINTLLCLKDWTVKLPLDQLCQSNLLPNLLEVLHAAASGAQECRIPETQVDLTLNSLESSPPKVNKNSNTGSTRSMKKIGTSSSVPIGVTADQIETISKSVINHLLSLIGHFPLPCGAAQMSSIVCEHQDSPSLEYLEELSSEIFDSPRVQFFSLNDEAIVTFIEIPAHDNDVPADSFITSNYQCRIIIRDVTGKSCWDSTILFGLKQPDHGESPNIPAVLIKPNESTESLCSGGADDSDRSSSSLTADVGVTDLVFSGNISHPPSWRNESSSIDHLHKLLSYVETTSTECILYPDISLTSPAPSVNEPIHIVEQKLQSLVEQQCGLEADYVTESSHFSCMKGQAVTLDYSTTTFAFHYCHLFLSHMGYLSWNKRNSLDLLEKTDSLIRDLKHLDTIAAQCRQTYKVAVLYVSCGQEDRHSILCNSQASSDFEEFVSKLGWEVDVNSHLGYNAHLKRLFGSNCTMPYYATASEEILFHVGTRMSPVCNDIEQMVRHLGNDEVHIIWSEHWRDYRTTIFKTQFADVVIIIYPLPNELYRIQIEKKSNIHFGPLFDGAVVDANSLPVLVRATVITALKAQRNQMCPTFRGRYHERWNYLQHVVDMKVKSSFEDFAQSIMHPLESGYHQYRQSPTKMINLQTQITTSSANLNVSLNKLDRLSETRWYLDNFSRQHQQHAHSLTPNSSSRKISGIETRPRSRTTDSNSSHFVSSITKNHSVPDLSEITAN